MNKTYLIKTFSTPEYIKLFNDGFADWKKDKPDEELKIKYYPNLFTYKIYFSKELYLIFKLKFDV